MQSMSGRARGRAIALACGSIIAASIAVTTAVSPAVAVVPAPIGPPTVVGGGWGEGGPATQARLASTNVDLSTFPDGELIYHEYLSNSIERVGLNGVVSCVADCRHLAGFGGDGGQATDALFSSPTSVAAAPDGSIYVADSGNNRLRRIDTNGIITTVAGTGSLTSWVVTGPALTTDVSPVSVAVGPDGTVYFEDSGAKFLDGHGGITVRKLAGGAISTVLGGAASSNIASWDGQVGTSLSIPGASRFFLAPGPTGGTLFLGFHDPLAGTGDVLSVASSDVVTLVAGGAAGNGPSAGDGGPAVDAHFLGQYGLVAEADGSLDVLDSEGIRHIVVGGVITALHAGVEGNGLASHGSTFYTTAGIAATSNRDTAIYAISADGMQTMVVGAKPAAVGDGGPLKDAWFRFSADTAFLPDGGLIVSQTLGTLRRVGTDGVVHTIAGSSVYQTTFSGEGGAATAAVLPGPKELAVDAAGDIFVSCSDFTVREILASDGTIHSVLGTGTPWTSAPTTGSVAGTSMPLGVVRSLSVAPDGALWVVDAANPSYDARVVVLSPDGATATQITALTLPSVSGTAAVGQPLGLLGGIDAAGVSASGDLVLVDHDGWQYRSTNRSTVTSVLHGVGNGWSKVRFDPSGAVVLNDLGGAKRFNADGSTDDLAGGIGAGVDSPQGVSVSATAATYLTRQGLVQRTIPPVILRPTTPATPLGPISGTSSLGLHLTAPLRAGQILTGFGYLGTASPLWQPLGSRGFYQVANGDLPMDVPEGFGGKTVTGVIWIYDATTGETSVPRTITYAERTPVTCPLSPTSRKVAYGATVTSSAVVSAYTLIHQPGVPGSWTISPGGLTAARLSAPATSNLGVTSHATKLLRTTAVTYSVTPGAWTVCTSTVTYSVAGVVKVVPGATSARRSAAIRLAATLAPHIAAQRLTLQRLVGTHWVSLKVASTPKTGVVVFRSTAPTRKGYASYRVVSSSSAALVGAISPITRIRVV